MTFNRQLATTSPRKELTFFSTMNIAIVLMEENPPFKQYLTHFLTMYRRNASEHPIGFNCTALTLKDCSFDHLKTFDGITLTGGVGDPNKREDLQALISYLPTLADQKPILGICMGLQLMTLATGGKVTPLFDQSEKYIASHTTELEEHALVPNPPSAEIYMCHQFRVSGLPKEANIYMSAKNIPVAAFRFRNFNGFQGHIEAGEEARRRMNENGNGCVLNLMR